MFEVKCGEFNVYVGQDKRGISYKITNIPPILVHILSVAFIAHDRGDLIPYYQEH